MPGRTEYLPRMAPRPSLPHYGRSLADRTLRSISIRSCARSPGRLGSPGCSGVWYTTTVFRPRRQSIFLSGLNLLLQMSSRSGYTIHLFTSRPNAAARHQRRLTLDNRQRARHFTFCSFNCRLLHVPPVLVPCNPCPPSPSSIPRCSASTSSLLSSAIRARSSPVGAPIRATASAPTSVWPGAKTAASARSTSAPKARSSPPSASRLLPSRSPSAKRSSSENSNARPGTVSGSRVSSSPLPWPNMGFNSRAARSVAGARSIPPPSLPHLPVSAHRAAARSASTFLASCPTPSSAPSSPALPPRFLSTAAIHRPFAYPPTPPTGLNPQNAHRAPPILAILRRFAVPTRKCRPRLLCSPFPVSCPLFTPTHKRSPKSENRYHRAARPL